MVEDPQCLYTGRVIGSAVSVEGKECVWGLAGKYINLSAEITSPLGEYRDLAMLTGERGKDSKAQRVGRGGECANTQNIYTDGTGAARVWQE
jgi:hypothetical protein